MSFNKILPYTKEARQLSRSLRKNQTETEKMLWQKIRFNQLGVMFFRQFPILDYVVDFYAKEIGLAIEIDGKYHDNQFLEDAHRQVRIEKLGVYFLRFSNKAILEDMDTVLSEIEAIIIERID
ncbi:endonuclease domain-containing protein [Gangjinia marincola]|uniref:Endonuclease domain-containing protein n=1 Tax=Gangjinia marincola TaxID=578463 RepID=A0ABN1MCU4_9FLAO